jgi:hypothetical protein
MGGGGLRLELANCNDLDLCHKDRNLRSDA